MLFKLTIEFQQIRFVEQANFLMHFPPPLNINKSLKQLNTTQFQPTKVPSQPKPQIMTNYFRNTYAFVHLNFER